MNSNINSSSGSGNTYGNCDDNNDVAVVLSRMGMIYAQAKPLAIQVIAYS
jgi:hypothetical protein